MEDHIKSDNIIEKKLYIGEIPLILFRPKEKEKLIPTIILYHGWSSNKESQRMRAFILATLGYQVVVPDAKYHGERGALPDYKVENGRKYLWKTIFSNLAEASTLIESIVAYYNGDPARIGVIGNSMGGFTAAGVFTHNPSLKALVVFNGSLEWEDSNRRFAKNYHMELGYELENRVRLMNPYKNMEDLVDRPILLLHGDDDQLVPIESQKIFYKKIQASYKNKARIKFVTYPGLNHFVTTNMMEESIAWFHKFL